MEGFKWKNTIVSNSEVADYLTTKFSQAYELYKNGICFFSTYEKMWGRPGIIRAEPIFDDFLRECWSAYLEDEDPEEPFYNPNDGYVGSSYGINSEKLKENFEKKYNKRLGSYDKAFTFSIYEPNNTKEIYYPSFPENNAELLIAIGVSPTKKSYGDECHIINISDELKYLKEDKYKYSDFYTYENILLISNLSLIPIN
jgi:hypothetical protein